MTDTKTLLTTNVWISELPDAVVEQLARHAQRRTLADGELLYARGDAPTCLFGVVSGRIRVAATNIDGREITVTYFDVGDWLGELSIFDGLPRISDAFAVGRTEVIAIPNATFQQLLEEQPRLYAPFVKILCNKLRLALHFAADMMLLPLSARLAKRLLDLARDYGETGAQGTLITLRLPQDELGRMLGASRQSISKELKAWEAEGLIRVAYGRITVCDTEGLRRLVQEE